MTSREKLIQRVLARPPEASFGDVRVLLEDFGWVLRCQRGSHVSFRHPSGGMLIFSLMHGRSVKRVYLDMIIAKLGLEESNG